MTPAGDLQLEVVAGRAAGFSFVVADRLVIGRSADGPGRLGDDPEISRHHAEIARVSSGAFTLQDLSSTNGTFVNGTQITAPVLLVAGDRLEMGETTLTVRSAPAAAVVATTVDVRADTMVGGRAVGTASGPVHVALTIDFDGRSAQLDVLGAGAPMQLVLDNGQWRLGNEGR